ncbi:MAG TPA: 2Fe-2S iron-sulfur cluster-binding protein [Sphingomonadaceae bacterium]|nr:2Fe-2S iron-sulfur cluster-binding protein [Sphingomonadaceae bacterium]
MAAGFYPLRIVGVSREADAAIALTLEPPPEARAAFAYTPGQHLTFRADIAGEDVRRNYSICAAPDEGILRVAIKQVEGGMFSTWALDAMTPGATIEAMRPHGSFTWAFSPDARRSYLAIAGGSGITPILSLIKAGLAVEPESRFTLFYGNRSSSSIMFLEELAALKDRYLDRLQVYHFLTAEADDVELFNGRLDEARLADALGALLDPNAVDVAFICGPGGLMENAERALAAAGVPADRVLLERFTAGRPSAEAEQADRELRKRAAGRKLQITIDGRRRRVEFDADKGSILESARAAGLPAPFACKAGVCATCRAKLVTGEVRMKANFGLTAEDVARGYILTCQAVPVSDDVAVDYDG